MRRACRSRILPRGLSSRASPGIMSGSLRWCWSFLILEDNYLTWQWLRGPHWSLRKCPQGTFLSYRPSGYSSRTGRSESSSFSTGTRISSWGLRSVSNGHISPQMTSSTFFLLSVFSTRFYPKCLSLLSLFTARISSLLRSFSTGSQIRSEVTFLSFKPQLLQYQFIFGSCQSTVLFTFISLYSFDIRYRFVSSLISWFISFFNSHLFVLQAFEVVTFR